MLCRRSIAASVKMYTYLRQVRLRTSSLNQYLTLSGTSRYDMQYFQGCTEVAQALDLNTKFFYMIF